MNTQATTKTAAVEFEDIQGIVRFGYKHHTEACFLLLHVKDVDAACTWLTQAPVTNAVTALPPPQTVLQVAFTSEGLHALGVSTDIIHGFSEEFVQGMSSDADRSRRLGDVGSSAPQHWQWGSSVNQTPHVLVALYAMPGQLAAWRQAIETQCASGFELMACLSVIDLHGLEPFGFADGISQPEIDWARQRPVRDQEQLAYSNLTCVGEFLLGYPNEYGLYTDRPLLDPALDSNGILPKAEDASDKVDLGRNGSYLVMRQLRQNVTGFWKFLDHKADGDPATRQRWAEAMVGRTLQGKPLVSMDSDKPGDTPATPDALNTFNYESDPQGIRCPLGAHIRRGNPRNADLPSGASGLISKLKRILGFDTEALAQDLVASTRFHRLLRRGRGFGVQVSPEQALSSASDIESGLHFICLNANISRQFEFVQSAWMVGTRFNGLRNEGDPLLGHRESDSDVFSIPRTDGPDERVCGLPRFINVVGGGYFFLPGIRALRYLASEHAKGEQSMDAKTGETNSSRLTDSNRSRPVPPSDTNSALLNWFSDISLKLLQFERRFDPWLRPAFDAVLRDPIARFVTFLINLQRKNEGLKLAEEKPLPDEEANLDSIVSTFTKQMTKLWKPGGFERGGNTKTHGIVRAEFIVHESLPAKFRHGIFAEPKTYKAWVRFSGPGPYVTPDIDDVGFMSISIKLLGVPGPKLMDEEKFTQDMFGVSTPTFVTPDTKANAHLQKWSLQDASLFHFLNFKNPHLLDLIMQGLFIKTQSSPFEAPYFSCVPYLLGKGQAMVYSVWPKSNKKTPIPRLPFRPPDDYLRQAMVKALDNGDVELDFRIQLQTDPHLMPIENAAVLWPERLSPRVSVATIRIPRQTFATASQIEFEKRLSFNPWHCIPEHRPLGNQSRARQRMYWELSKLRHSKNNVPHYEPNGDEEFE